MIDGLFAGICGILVGVVSKFMDRLKANPFFSTVISSFLMALPAYTLGSAGIVHNPDMVIIGALILLVQVLMINNAMRDIIFGDTNSGINRIVQVVLIAGAIGLGTGFARSLAVSLFGAQQAIPPQSYSAIVQCIAAAVGCTGFCMLFNIHGKGGLLCALGGVIAWLVYSLVVRFGGNDLTGYFWATLVAAAYSETMARVRKCPAISYLVVSIFPLIPGASVYYTMNYAVRGQMELFASQGMHTAAIAGIMAVAILLVSTVVRMILIKKNK